VLGVPARYIHTHNSVLDVADLGPASTCAVALVRRLDAPTVKALTPISARARTAAGSR
jgi:endoglucanase